MTWTDRPGSSVRDDGLVKIGQFRIENTPEWWAYPKGGPATGPFNTLTEAKDAMSAWLGMETHDEHRQPCNPGQQRAG
jgi:hypothetical protein